MHEILLGKYLTLQEFCTCTQTYRKYGARINPYPENPEETIPALKSLCKHILDPVIAPFGREQFQLTYGFCSKDLKRFLAQKDPETDIKNGRVDPSRDQHMAHEKNRNGKYYCDPLRVTRNARLIEWILEQQLPFDSLYYYGGDPCGICEAARPIHISYASQQRQNIWTFTDRGVPTRKGVESWIKATNHST